jgi:F-type H+-transporting ATPase subunit a
MTTATSTTPIAEPRGPVPSVPGPPVGEPRKGSLFGRLFFPVVAVLLAVWGWIIATGDPVAKEEFDPTAEFSLSDPVFGGQLGPTINDVGIFTINKGVIYVLIALLGCVLFAVYVNRTIKRRLKQETRTQSAVEAIYEFAYDQIAGSLNADPKIFRRYMPFVAAVFIFVWFINMTSFVPLPLNTHHTVGGLDWLYSFGVYAVSSNIFFTITLALCTFAIYHFEGVRAHGLGGYLKTWTAGQKGPVLGLVYPVEILTNVVLKPVSLAVRLFANMLSGHVLILLMLALSGVIAGSFAVTVLSQAAGTVVALAFYLFEMGLVASLQAFIFAVLSAIYISSAVEQHH